MKADEWVFPVAGHEGGLPYAEVGGVRVYDARTVIPSDTYPAGTVEKMGYAVHHDAVSGALPTSMAGEIERIRAIDRYHRAPPPAGRGWPGFGYHRMIAPSGNVYIVASSSTVRAHVAGLNHLWIGYCFMGDWSSGRPPEAAMHAFREVTQWETDMRGVPMLLRAHKGLNPGTTACPGGWAAADAWEGIALQPKAPGPPPPVVDLAALRGHAEVARAALRTVDSNIAAIERLVGGGS